ncbi:hypothetical protein BC628DRAFT_1419089 [Trametes gibbosa]|nr:hypothetical protein BC628DRAFT_1419089 [Trametes gibbosa]
MRTGRSSCAWATYVALGLLRAAFVRAGADPVPPPVLSPRSGDVWTVGEIATVKWSTDGIPLFIPETHAPWPGTVWLGELTDTSSGFTFWALEPLADGFPLLNKEVQVVVPNVPSGSNYIIILDKPTNQGQVFTINNPKDVKGTGAIPSSISVSTLPFSTSTAGSASTMAAANTTVSSAPSSSALPSSVNATSPGVSLSGTSTAPAPSSSSMGNTTTPSSAVPSGTSTTSTSSTSSGSSTPSASTAPVNGAIRLGGAGVGLGILGLSIMSWLVL